MKEFISMYIMIFLGLSLANAQMNIVSFNDTSGILIRDTLNFNPLHGSTISYSLQDSMKDGEWIVFYDNDTTKPLIKYNYVNNIKNGKYTQYYPNGNIQATGLYLNGKKVGLWKGFYETGKVFMEYFIIENELRFVARTINKYDNWNYATNKNKRRFLRLLRKEEKG